MSFNLASRVNSLDKTTQQLLYSIMEYAPRNSPTLTGAVAGITPSMIGLGNVNNTSDVDKPVSTATQNALGSSVSMINAALALKADTAALTSNAATLTSAIGLKADTANTYNKTDVDTKTTSLLNNAPIALNTLRECCASSI